MIPKEVILKAKQGGWDGEWDNSLGPVEHRGTENAVGWEVVALSAAFWQALGEALGWEDDPGNKRDFRGFARRFYDLILTNSDTAAFWREILK